MTVDESLEQLIENAFDFLIRGAQEFEKSPKYSVLHFAIAIELFLKARLMDHDWKLVVNANKKQPADLNKFLNGEFKSIYPGEAFRRLRNDLSQPLSQAQEDIITKIAHHRNKMVHFHHSAISEKPDVKLKLQIAREQYTAWHHLEQLLTQDWQSIFSKYTDKIDEVRNVMRAQHKSLDAVFKRVQKRIQKFRQKGGLVTHCSKCRFDSVCYRQPTVLFTKGCCWVCKERPTIVSIPCAKCSSAWLPLDYALPHRCKTCRRVLETSERDVEIKKHASEPHDPDGELWFLSQQYLPCGDSSCCGTVPIDSGYQPFCKQCNRLADSRDAQSFFLTQTSDERKEIETLLGTYICNECRGFDTLIQIDQKYICLQCNAIHAGLQTCKLCGRHGTAMSEYSRWVGCAVCGGEKELEGLQEASERYALEYES